MTNDRHNDRLLLHALADHELDAATALTIEARLATEPALAAEYAQIVALKERLGGLEKPAVSEDFLARLGALASADAGRPAPKRVEWISPGWRALAASVLVAACLASCTTYMLTAQRDGMSIEDAIANGHRRSLLAASPTDVASSDRHTVRPWFDAKLGLSPPTIDLTDLGFPLVGGRVEVVAGNAVPSLVYRHRQHLISVVAIPQVSAEATAPISKTIEGYNMVQWSAGGFGYWAVSDLDAADLKSFADDLRAR